MTPSPDAPLQSPTTFRLKRVSRVSTRSHAEHPRWSQYLGSLTFIALIVLVLLGPWMTIDNASSQNILRQIGYGVILVLTLIAIRPWRHPERLLVLPWPILLALVWCWVTLLWAIDPSVGLRRLALTTLIIWSLFALVRQLGTERTVAILRITLAVTLAVNFFFVIFFPAIGTHVGGNEFDGKWRGLMGHKNNVGITCAMTVLFFVFYADRVNRFVRMFVCSGAAVFLVMSDSKTSMGICLAGAVVGFIFGRLAMHKGQRRLAPPAIAWALLVVPAIIFLSMAIDNSPYLEMVSDPAGFTGRTQIWTALIKAYADHPLFGIGYGSFWDLGPSGPIFKYASNWVTTISEGHNGYLDLLVQVGCVGTLLVLFATLVWPTQRLLYGGDHPARTLGAALVVFCIGHNFTESQLFDRDSQVQVFLMIALALLWAVTAAPVGGSTSSIPTRRKPAAPPRAPLRL